MMEDGGQIFAYQGGPEVGFHVPSAGFQQQGGGAGPPNTSQLRAIHHSHHGGNPPIPPQHQQPPQGQSQHTGGPQGPVPTSTPPGPAEMGKQGPSHLQGQPQMQQGGQMQMNFVPNQTRATSTQAYFPSGPRGPTPRMPNHRNQVVNMQPNNVGPQIFQQHVQMSQMQVYGQQVMSTQLHTPQMFVQPQLPVLGNQPRHQTHTGNAYYQQAGPQHILMAPQVYPSFQHTPQSAQYYYPGPMGIGRPGAGVTGGPGPGLASAANQQVMGGGPPPAQLGQPGGPVAMGIVPGPGGVVGVTGLSGNDSTAGQTTISSSGKQARRKFAIEIVDPKTMKTVNLYDANLDTNNTPPRSGDSSARDTPQPNTGSGTMTVAADFAARVAKVASEDSSPPPPSPSVSQVGPPAYVESPPQGVTANGPDLLGTSSIPDSEGMSPNSILTQSNALSLSKQQIIVVEETNNMTSSAPSNISTGGVMQTPWKQGQINQTTMSNSGSKSSASINKSDISNQTVTEEKIVPAKMENELPVLEFVPSVSAADSKISPNNILIGKESESTPVVSAQTNAPAVEVVRNREQFPALKPSVPVHQSPRRKQQSQTQRPETTSSVPQATTVTSNTSIQSTLPPALTPSRETTPVAEMKLSKKPSSEESIPPSTAFLVSQPPKEKRDQEKQQGRDRDKPSSISSSQSRNDREKSVSSSSSSQHHGREREKSSRDKDKSATSQSGPKDRDKSASQGRDSDKSSMKEVTPIPSPLVPVIPNVTQAAVTQPEQSNPSRAVVAAEEGKQQTNGEIATVDATDGKASQQRAKPKQRHQKMRDINRKGAEKEGGTDMDAFMETQSEDTSVTAPLAPPISQPPPLPPPPPPPPVSSLPANKAADNQLVKEEETEADKEVKLVAARNEENTKVSAAALKEDDSNSPPVIENIPPTKPTSLTLRHTYKDDQWSPLNPEGKKKYERDFLMELQNDPQSKRKLNLPANLDIVLKDGSNKRQMDRSYSSMNRPISDSFAPGFMRTPNPRGQPIPKRNSQQGKPNKGSKTNVLQVTLSLEQVKLHETENAWKPHRMKSTNLNEEEIKTEELYKKVRGVLNKLTPQKFNPLVTQVQALPIDTIERLVGVINLVFDKAVDEPKFSVAYAKMCNILSTLKVPGNENIDFRKLLLTRCQQEFEKSSEVELNRKVKLKEIEAVTDPEKKKELQLNFDEEKRKIRMKSVGNTRFIGELFKLQMLTKPIMVRCVKDLLQEGDEESLECLCKLLTTIGKDLEDVKEDLTPYFSKMKELSQKKGHISSRVRFMLQDVIDLRQSKWVPRRDESDPKTMDQIQKEAEKETLDQSLLLSTPQTPRRQDDRSQPNRKNKGSSMSEDGWSTVNAPKTRYTVDTTKLRAPKEDQGQRLGGNYLFASWMYGANSKKDTNKSTMSNNTPSNFSSNIFSALDTSNEEVKRPPPLISGSRSGPGKVTPSPSMEKERMLASFKSSAEGDNRQSRNSASRSSSRDSSLRRGGDELNTVKNYAPLPSSVSASSEDISNSGIVPGTKSPVISAAPVPQLNNEEMKKKTLNLLDEFLQNNNYKESELLVTETFSSQNLSLFVNMSLNDVLERKSSSRLSIGKLMGHFVKERILPLNFYLIGLNDYLEFADDIAIDVPKFWPYVAEFIVPMLLSEAMSFADLKKIAHPEHGKLILEILQLLVRDRGPGWIREKWEAANLNWTDFLPADKVDAFVKQNKLEFTQGGAVATASASSSAALSWVQVQQKLEQFLKPEQASTSTFSFDQICDWINANLGDRAKEPEFIRALMTAICCSAIESQKSTYKLNENHFQQHLNLIMKYVDHKEEFELQCLYAVQSLINKLEHPQGLLCQIFQLLWDDNTISIDSFIAWESSTDPAEKTGKGVALKSLTSFFTAIHEGYGDSSCEDS